MNTTKTPSANPSEAVGYAVKFIVMHKLFHVDEAWGHFLLRQKGETMFPGVGTAKVIFSENCPDAPQAVWAARCQLPIGTGGGMFDEHRNGLGGSRVKGECASSLIRKTLGGSLLHDKAIKRIADEVRYFDENAGCPKGHLAEFIKIAHRCMNGNFSDPVLLRWCDSIFTAVYNRMSLNHSAAPGEKSFSEHAEVVFKSKPNLFNDGRAVRYVLNELRNAERFAAEDLKMDREELVLSLDFIYKSLVRTGAEDASENIMFIVDKMYADQVAFLALLPIAQKSARIFEVPVLLRKYETRIKVAVFVSEDPRAAKVLGQIGAKVRVVISNGRPVILKDKRIEGLSLNHLRGMLRWMELPPQKKNAVPFDQLVMTEGFHRLVPEWYGCEFMVANGTDTHTDLPKTHLMDAAIRDALQHAFHPEMIARWKKQRGITTEVKQQKEKAPVKPVPTPAPVVVAPCGNGTGAGYTNTIGAVMEETIGTDIAGIVEAPQGEKVVVTP